MIRFFLFSGSGMSPKALSAMTNGAGVSSVTVWEITRKAAQGHLPALPVIKGSFVGWLETQNFIPLPLTWAAAEHANALPPVHKDPMDRLLIAQALLGGLAVITNDRLFPAYGVPTIW